MNRPVFYVDQKEDLEKGTFWWTVATSNGRTILTSEMYSRRRDARRAALAFVKTIEVRVVFRYHTGPTSKESVVIADRGWVRFMRGAGVTGVSVGGGGNGEAFGKGKGVRFQ